MQTIYLNHTIDPKEIKEKADILDIIGSIVDLKKKGNRWWGLCPFHQEKTPSFTVNPEKQRFHCFGCGADGDVLQFVQDYYHLDFPAAQRWLGDRYGISPTTDAPSKAKIKQINQEREQARQREDRIESIIREQYNRLCEIERSIYKIIGSISCENDLDKPIVIAALQSKSRVEHLLNGLLSLDPAVRIEAALAAGRWGQ